MSGSVQTNEGNLLSGRLGNASAALRYRNYRLWFVGQMASLVGTWMQSTAQAFLIYQLTHSTAYLGYVVFASGVPTWLLMLYGGVASDRMSRRNLLLVTQAVMMILAFILAGLTFSGLVQPWHILVLATLLGIANAFDAPARQAFVVELVERPDLANAIALNSTMVQLAKVIGPAAAGIIYATFGAAWCFSVNGVSFIAVIAALLLMHISSLPARPHRASVGHEILEGLRYSLGDANIRALIAIIGAVGLFTTTYVTLFPAWAVSILHGDAATNGWLESMRGVGALAGAMLIAALGRFRWKGRLLMIGIFLYPVGVIVFALIAWTPLSLAELILVGGGFMIVTNMTGTLLQVLAPEQLRGRVTGVYSLVAFGTVSLGALAAGAAAEWLGAPLTIILGGLIALLFAVWLFFFVPGLRRVE